MTLLGALIGVGVWSVPVIVLMQLHTDVLDGAIGRAMAVGFGLACVSAAAALARRLGASKGRPIQLDADAFRFGDEWWAWTDVERFTFFARTRDAVTAFSQKTTDTTITLEVRGGGRLELVAYDQDVRGLPLFSGPIEKRHPQLLVLTSPMSDRTIFIRASRIALPLLAIGIAIGIVGIVSAFWR